MITWGYIAGFIDGDGWISSSITNERTGNIRYQVGLTQSVRREPRMFDIADFLRSRGIACSFIKRRKNWKSKLGMINVVINRKSSVVELLTKIRPYLLLKKELANDALIYLKEKARRRAVLPCRSLNAKKWTLRDLLNLRDYVSSDWTNAMISNKMGRGTNSIALKISRLNLRNNYVPLQKEKVLRS